MQILKKIFNRKSAPSVLQYGRHSHVVNSPQRFSYWDYSFKMYEAKRYQDAYKSLLLFLENSSGNNVTIDVESRLRFTFEIIQGSKKILGRVNESGIFCEVKVAKAALHDKELYRQLLEENYYRNHTKFGLDTENNICLLFQAEHINASPLRLYYALKEMAITADKNDDVWISQHPHILPIQSDHKLEAPQLEKQQKFEYFLKRYQDLKSYLNENDAFLTIYPGAKAYLILDFAFTIDYLLKPEGKMMRIVEDMIKSYSNQAQPDPNLKIQNMISLFNELESIDELEFYSEIYPTVYTFGTPAFTNHQSVREVISSEVQNIQWYLDNGKEEIGVAIARYIAGYLFYTYTIPSYDRELLHLLYEVSEHAFFTRFDQPQILNEFGKPSKKKVVYRIESIIKTQKETHVSLEFPMQEIDFTNCATFMRSYLYGVANLKILKEEKN